MKRWTILFFALVLALMTGSTALASDSNGPARIRVVHASPDAPRVNVMVDGRVLFSNVPYRAVTRYLPLEAGSYNIKVVTADRGQAVVIDANLDLTSGADYTIAAVGLAANIEPLVLMDDNQQANEPGKAKVRFVHASPDAPAVDVAVKEGDILLSNVAFKGATDYVTVDAGPYNLEVREAGTDSVALEIPWIMLPPGSSVTIFALGLAGGEPSLQAKLLFDSRFSYRYRRPVWHGFPPRFLPHPPFFGPPRHYHPQPRRLGCYGCTPYYRPQYHRYSYRYW